MPEELGYRDFAGMRIAAAFHRGDRERRRVVVMAHGFRSSKIGPSRYFVGLARELAERGVSAFRFDQPGSGDSEGVFDDSSFLTWIETIEHFGRQFAAEGYGVALLGQSMGGRAALAAAARLADALRGLALWSPATMLDAGLSTTGDEWVEEEGQRVGAGFWREAADVDFLRLYRGLAVPAYIVFGTADTFVAVEDMRAVERACKPGDRIRVIEGLPHSAWPEPHRTEILRETAEFLTGTLRGP